MYSIEHVDRDKPPRMTRFMALQPMCGLCKFKCCRSPSLEVETTEEESERMDLPRRFPINGGCRCLGAAGCVHGDARPVLCKLAPAQIKDDNTLVVSHWFILNCPYPKDYTLTHRDEEGRYHYRLNDEGVSGQRRNNAHETLVLDHPIEEVQDCLGIARDALVELYGEEAYAAMRADLDKLTRKRKGFGFDKPK